MDALTVLSICDHILFLLNYKWKIKSGLWNSKDHHHRWRPLYLFFALAAPLSWIMFTQKRVRISLTTLLRLLLSLHCLLLTVSFNHGLRQVWREFTLHSPANFSSTLFGPNLWIRTGYTSLLLDFFWGGIIFWTCRGHRELGGRCVRNPVRRHSPLS